MPQALGRSYIPGRSLSRLSRVSIVLLQPSPGWFARTWDWCKGTRLAPTAAVLWELGLHWGMTSALITAGQLSAGQKRTNSFLRLWQDKGAGIPMGDSGSHSVAVGACPGPGVVEQLECSHSYERVVHGELK